MIEEGKIGKDQEMFLTDSMDTWNPSVRGNFARVFQGFMKYNGLLRRGAVKFMRHENKEAATPLFRTEVQILEIMKGLNIINTIDTVVPMWECGFIQPENLNIIPGDGMPGNLRELRGTVRRFLGETSEFANQLEQHVEDGWLPYLVIEPLDRKQNLLLLSDPAYTPANKKYFEVLKALHALAQACVILDVAHKQNVVYKDHKIVHCYWDDEWDIFRLMDWNCAHWYPNGLSEESCEEDITQFIARMAFPLLTGRRLPGALGDSSTPEMIDAEAGKKYDVMWKYDDERLPRQLREMIEQALQRQFKDAKTLGEKFADLLESLE